MIAAICAIAAACDLPRDPEKTLERIRERGVIVVGVTEEEPFMRRASLEPNAGAAGVEAELIRGLAAKLGVGVRWEWGSAEQHYEAVEKFELDLVAGGMTDATPWKTKVGLTRPYVTSRITVGFPPATAPVTDLTNVRVAVEPASPHIALLEEEEALPVVSEHPFETGLPVVAPEWELRAHGYALREEPLAETKHVMAVPPGENEWLVTVEHHLLPMKERIESMLEKESGK